MLRPTQEDGLTINTKEKESTTGLTKNRLSEVSALYLKKNLFFPKVTFEKKILKLKNRKL